MPHDENDERDDAQEDEGRHRVESGEQHATSLRQWTIYEHPSDYPEHFVVREWVIYPGGAVATDNASSHATLEEARESVPAGLWCMGRDPLDDPCIVEVWL